MTTRFRVVDHAATGQRFRTVRLPGQNPQYMSPAQAALRGQLTGEQSNPSKDNFSNMPMNPTPGGGSDGAAGIAAGVGLPGRPSAFRTHKGPHGFPVPNIFNPIGPGTRFGSVLQQSEGGRQVAAHFGAQYPGPGGQLDPFAVGGQLYGRGYGTELVSDPGRTGPAVHPASTSQIGDLLARGASFWHSVFKAMTVKGGVGSTVILLPTKYLHTRYRDLFGKTPTAYPTVDPGQGQPRPPSPYDAGYYPTATPEQHGGHAMSSALLLDTLAEVYRRMQQQAHSPAGSDAGAGAGTSAAPERLFLHGMKHWYDMVAGRTQ